MLISFCGCDEPEQKSHFDEDLFPNSKQIWGMIGTILATVACWVFYTKMHVKRKRHVPQQNTLRIHTTGRRGHN